jgi:hypothetical protein
VPEIERIAYQSDEDDGTVGKDKRFTAASGPARMTATAPATGSSASQPGKRISAVKNAADVTSAAKPAKEIQDRTLSERTIWRRQARAAPAKSSQKRETGR